ncbi:MAG TPA: hypothetical protein VFM39_01935 [bacterium]|nr:hypothetical protein [bacterium]
MKTTFETREQERDYLANVKAELDRSQTKAEVVDVWTRHYLTIGHRKLGRLLLGRPLEEILKARE